jgi:formylglycine-generating enzyme required for sulfatase activity
MITQPAEATGYKYEEDLEWRILEESGNQPGALALTAYALEQLWEAANKREDSTLTIDDYESFGGVEGAIGQQAQAAYEALKMDDEAKREALRQVFARLIAVEPRTEGGGYTATRKRGDLNAVRGDEDSDTDKFVDAFIAARLLTADHGVLEVAHEALLRQWKLLRDWINEAGEAFRLIEDMKRDARRWRDTGDDVHLWRQERMDRFHAVLDERPELDAELDDDRALYERFLRDEWLRIAEWVVVRDLDHHTRRDYGDRLNELGDPRPGVGVLTEVVPLDVSASMAPMLQGAQAENAPTFEEVRLWGNHRDHMDLPDIVFVKINPPAEPWTMVDDEGNEYGPFSLKSFYLAKYPVTNAQFSAFAEAEDGFKSGRWYEGLARQESELKDANRPTPNHPRERINWYDSIAFCRWLNHRLGWPDIPFDLTPDTLHTYSGLRLPTEWEWQFAAQNGDPANTYPWGAEWDGRKANTSESGLSRTTAVGMYPPAPCGAFDLSGNVYDWCLNEYETITNVGLSSRERRILRGGAWSYFYRRAASSFRSSYDARNRGTDFGFRLARSL